MEGEHMGDSTFAVLVLAQITLLVMYYGFGIAMPWFIVWLPALFIAFLIALGLVFVVAIAVIAIFR
jgi:hypothetical protein